MSFTFHILVSRSLGIKKFPAVAIKTKLQDKFQTVLCYEGFLDIPTLMSLVQSVLLACEAEIAQAAEISAMRSLQSEQDAAYLRSLEIDKEKLKLRKRVAELPKSRITEVTEDTTSTVNTENNEGVDTKVSNIYESEQRLNERIIKARMDLENEPEDGNVFKFQFLFPDGTRKIRKFSSNSHVKVTSVYNIIFILSFTA